MYATYRARGDTSADSHTREIEAADSEAALAEAQAEVPAGSILL